MPVPGDAENAFRVEVLRFSGWRFTLTYQDLLFCRVPINSILGFIIRTYEKVGLVV